MEVSKFPGFIIDTIRILNNAGFSAEIVGGPVRDLLTGGTVKDIDNWDLATNATPEEMMKLFENAFYENDFGTVTIPLKLNPKDDKEVTEVEVTPYRVEEGYSDKRHPDKVTFTQSLEDDLSRRDFTINAMALRIDLEKDTTELIDPFGGQKDLKAGIIKAVGVAQDRITEDALRMMRAIRFAARLGFEIEQETLSAVEKQAADLKDISAERIRDELNKIVMSERPQEGFELLKKTGLLEFVMPELLEGMDIGQRGDHKHDVYVHSLLTVQYAAEEKYGLELRLAALMHDIGKPRTRELKNGIYTFYSHNTVGEEMALEIMKRLKYSKKQIQKVGELIRHHMFFYDTEEVSESGVRRLLRRVGPENMRDLLKLRVLDRKATPVPKAKPYKLRHLEFMLEKVAEDPIDVGQLKMDGDELMKLLEMQPGPMVGVLLKTLLLDVLDDPKRNTKEYLQEKAQEYSKLPKKELNERVKKLYQHEEERVKNLKNKHWVK